MKIFSILVCLIGIGWLLALHVDILWYKHSASRQVGIHQQEVLFPTANLRNLGSGKGLFSVEAPTLVPTEPFKWVMSNVFVVIREKGTGAARARMLDLN